MPAEINIGKCPTCTTWKQPLVEFGPPVAMADGFRYLIKFKCGSCNGVLGQTWLNEGPGQ
jgi:hypothetical protein